MLAHFQWKSNLSLREWSFSFFHDGQFITGTYYKNGHIKWGQSVLTAESKKKLEPHIHDLMLYHVYEQH
ncbi:DUF5342 family protein [Halalkalibacter kiskunsagensis]|uniref:DUF5342 family protein n=1 Tax=Halalkalibacter kiskunsagensis TaxID=1548599 RepID=A0ABV6KL56_9BACI